MHEQHGFNFVSHIPGLRHLPNHVGMTILVGVILILAVSFARAKLAQAMQAGIALVPEGRLTYRTFFEMIAESLYGLTTSVIGKEDAPHFYPMIGALFIFVFGSNLIGLVPGFQPSTDNMNTALALGVFVFLYYNYIGFRTHGVAYLKQFLGPMIYIAPLMFVIEVASHVFRPLSLALRLRGNILGDHIVLQVFSGLVPYLLPVIFYGLGVFVAFMQAFVFCLMTMVYISLSTSHDH